MSRDMEVGSMVYHEGKVIANFKYLNIDHSYDRS